MDPFGLKYLVGVPGRPQVPEHVRERIIWLKPEERIEHEFSRLREESANPSALEERWRGYQGVNLEEQRRVALEFLDAVVWLRRTDEEFDVPRRLGSTGR